MLVVQLGPASIRANQSSDRVSEVGNCKLAVVNEAEKASRPILPVFLISEREEVSVHILKH